MDYQDLAAWPQRLGRVSQQSRRFIAMQNVEQQHRVGADTETKFHHIAIRCDHTQPCSTRNRARHHLPFNVKRINNTSNRSGDWNRKSTVSAPEFRYVMKSINTQARQNQRNIEKGFPIGFIGHPAVAHFHSPLTPLS